LFERVKLKKKEKQFTTIETAPVLETNTESRERILATREAEVDEQIAEYVADNTIALTRVLDDFHDGHKEIAIELADKLLDSRRRRTVLLHRIKLRYLRWNKKRKEKYAEKRKARAEFKHKHHLQFTAMAKQSSNWYYYHEVNYWIHKNALLHPVVRSAIPLILNNPSWTHKQKRDGLDTLQRYIRNALRFNNAFYRDLYAGLWRPGHKTTPDTTKDPDATLPTTYEAIVRKAESAMPPEEVPRRYIPPIGKSHTKHSQY